VISSESIESFFKRYADRNLELRNKKYEIVKKFLGIESEMRAFDLVVSSLEQRFFALGLKRYEKISRDMRDLIISSFNPYDMNFNVDNVKRFVDWLDAVRKDFESANERIAKGESIYMAFTSSLDSMEGKMAVFKRLEEDLEMLNVLVREVSFQNIGTLKHDLDEILEDIRGIVKMIEKAAEYRKYYVFLGDRAQNLKERLDALLEGRVDLETGDFVKELKEIMRLIEEEESGATFTTVPVPVVELRKESDPSVRGLALLFGDFVHDFYYFLEKGEKPIYEETGEYIYFQHFPYEGVFRVENFLANPASGPIFDPTFPPRLEKKMNFDENYVLAVETISKRAYNIFNFLAFLGGIGTLVSFFLPAGWMLFDLSLVAGMFASYPIYVKRALRPLVEEEFDRSGAFLFSKIDFVYWSVGEDVDLYLIGPKLLENFEETVLNERYREWLKKNSTLRELRK
jgi:hypothetical protein